MDDMVDSILRAYGSADACSRDRIARYLKKLQSAGHSDAHSLAEYGLAYLRELHEGPDRGYTGC